MNRHRSTLVPGEGRRKKEKGRQNKEERKTEENKGTKEQRNKGTRISEC